MGDQHTTRADRPRLEPAQAFGLWLVLTPALIDYRFLHPNATTLSLYAVLALLSFSGSALLWARYRLRPGAAINRAAAIGFLFAFEATGIGFMYGQGLMEVLRAAPPLFLYASGLLAIAALYAGRASPRAVWRHVVVAVGLAMLIQLGSITLGRGISLSTVRYEVLSSSAAVMSGYAISLLFLGGATLVSLLAIGLHVGLVLLSVTRTQLAAALAAAAAIILATRGRVLVSRSFGRGGIPVLAVMVLAIGAGSLIPGSPLERWETRMFTERAAHRGVDITAMARAGEARFQVDRLKGSPLGLVFGFGVAAPTAFDARTAQFINVVIGSNNGYFTESGVGHNNYVGTIYIGGLLAGGLMLWSQLTGLWKGIVALRRLNDPDLVPFGGLSGVPLSYVALLTCAALTPLLAWRGTALMTGIMLGLCLWLYDVTAAAPAAKTGQARVGKWSTFRGATVSAPVARAPTEPERR